MKDTVRFTFKNIKEARVVEHAYELIEQLTKRVATLEGLQQDPPENKPTAHAKKHICGKVGTYKMQCKACEALKNPR